jgi:hypothetical protein
MISILSNKFSIHIIFRSFYKHIRWIHGNMYNLAINAILIKMSGILAFRAIQAPLFHESGHFVNKSTFVLLRNVPKTLMLESEPLTLPHLVIGIFIPMTVCKCLCKTINDIS